MYSTLPAFVLGFHGCDSNVGEEILAGHEVLRPSQNDYDWLGHGRYFWENNPARALEYAKLIKANPNRTRGKIENPFVVGAVIDLGQCLNLLESNSLQFLKEAHTFLFAAAKKTGAELPKNKMVAGDLLIRHLDCAVVEAVHQVNESQGRRNYDSVRGVFMEGVPLYEGTEFRERNHIQICVRNPNCIKGFFRVRETDGAFKVP